MSVPAPAITVVVAAWAGETRLAACLESLRPQWGAAEIIVVANGPPDVVERLRDSCPTVRFVQAQRDAIVPQLRAMGAAQAKGRLVVLIEDHCTAGPDFVAALCRARAAGQAIIGGPVDNGNVGGAYDWALFFCEYGYHMVPGPEGPAPAVSGVNVAYDRDVLNVCGEVWREALYEGEVNDALAAAGHRPYVAADAWVVSYLPMGLGEAMVHLFEGGRHYARYRVSESSLPARLLWTAASPAVPLILFARIHRRVASRDARRLRHLWRGVGYCVLLLGSWALGEAAGYLRGPEPGSYIA